jgi:parallel beta-helix repeat protein
MCTTRRNFLVKAVATLLGTTADASVRVVDSNEYGRSVVPNAQALRALAIYPGPYPETVETLGALTAGDGGNGLWRWDAASTAADNLGTVLLPTGHNGPGRWVRTFHGELPAAAFGVVADDATDNAAALNAALSLGVAIRLAPGVTRIKGKLTPASKAQLLGGGKHTSTLYVDANISAIEIGAVQDVRIADMTIKSDITMYARTGNTGIYAPPTIGGWKNLRVENVRIESFAGGGIIVQANAANPAKGCYVTNTDTNNTGAHGIIAQDYVETFHVYGGVITNYGQMAVNRGGLTGVRDGSDVRFDSVTIETTGSQGTNYHCISLEGRNCAVSRCRVDGGAYGIEIAADNAVVTNNIITNCQSGIAVPGSPSYGFLNDNAVVANNVIYNDTIAGDNGILCRVNGATSANERNRWLVIDGNAIHGQLKIGIHIFNASDGVITNNVVLGTYQSGVFVAESENISISGNRVTGCNTSKDGGHAGIFMARMQEGDTSMAFGNLLSGNGVQEIWATNAANAPANLKEPIITANAIHPFRAGAIIGHPTSVNGSFDGVFRNLWVNQLQLESAPAATIPGNLVRKIEVFNRDGTLSLGFIAVYDNIT